MKFTSISLMLFLLTYTLMFLNIVAKKALETQCISFLPLFFFPLRYHLFFSPAPFSPPIETRMNKSDRLLLGEMKYEIFFSRNQQLLSVFLLVREEQKRGEQNGLFCKTSVIVLFAYDELFEQISFSLGCYRLVIDSQMTTPMNKLH